MNAPLPTNDIASTFQQYSSIVQANPLDFNSWVQLLAIAESETTLDINTVRQTFDRFLIEFPLCFGYWNKYAQFEYTRSSLHSEQLHKPSIADAAKQVYERAVVAVRYSVDIWMNYLTFLVDTVHADATEVRILLERAAEACGHHPLSGPLWEKYILFETQQNEMVKLNHVFKRSLGQPLANIADFWEKYNHFVLAQQLSVLATSDELRNLASNEGEARDEGILRVKVVAQVEKIKNQSLAWVDSRLAYETKVNERTYFHVTPVSADIREMWNVYLDFEEGLSSNDDADDDDNDTTCRIDRLYERYVIVCANYSEAWIRYAHWKERVASREAATAVYQRATTIYLKYRADIYFAFGLALESWNQVEEARRLYQSVCDQVAPGSVEGMSNFAQFEKRQGRLTEALEILRAGVSQCLKVDDQACLYLSMAQIQHRECHDAKAAEEIYLEGIQRCPGSKALVLSYVHFELSFSKLDDEEEEEEVRRMARIQAIFTQAIENALTKELKTELWQQYRIYMETYASSAKTIRDVIQGEYKWKTTKASIGDAVISDPTSVNKRPAEAANLPSHPVVKQPRQDTAAVVGYYGSYQGMSPQAQAHQQPQTQEPQQNAYYANSY